MIKSSLVPGGRRIVLPWLVGVAGALVLYREGRIFGFDAYYYCEFAKLYSHSWPQAFGNDWPCGYPLLGGLLGRLGLPAYPALCVISVLSLGALIVFAANLLREVPFAVFPLIALALLPEVGVQLFGAMTELPFAAALLGVAAALNAWPRPRAFWLAGVCALLALSLRYAGILAIGVLWIWLLLRGAELRQKKLLGRATLATAAATVAALGLLYWNYRATGHLSGASRDAAARLGLAALPGHAADFGWSLPSALMWGGVRDRLGGTFWPGRAIGSALFLSFLALCLWGCLRPRRPLVRACAWVALSYGVGMVALRCCGNFDALYNARTFLPAAFPLGLVLAGQCLPRGAGFPIAVFGLMLVAGVVSTVRGISRQIDGDVRPAVPLLQERLRAGDKVQINDEAVTLAGYLSQPVLRAWPEHWAANRPERFLVIAAKPLDRRGSAGAIAPAWNALAARLAATGTHRVLLDTPGLKVLERIAPDPSP